MVFAAITVVDTPLVRGAIELARSSSEPYLFNHAIRSWLFGVLIAEGASPSPDPAPLAVSAVLHDLGLTDHHQLRQHPARHRYPVCGGLHCRDRLIEPVKVVWVRKTPHY